MNMILRAWAAPMSESWTRRTSASHKLGEDKKSFSKWSMNGTEQTVNYGFSSQVCAHSFGGGTCSRMSPDQFESFSYSYEDVSDDESKYLMTILLEGLWPNESQ